jgi:DNA-binding XRE family transcriptional regulator
MRARIDESRATEIGEAIRRLRAAFGLTQVKLSSALNVAQSAVAHWENGDRDPPWEVIIVLAEMAPEQDRQWWRDQASTASGVSLAKIRDPRQDDSVKIVPLMKNSPQGNLLSVSPADIEMDLPLPTAWFSAGGTFRAVRIEGPIWVPFAGKESIAVIDVGQSKPSRLVDCVVAVRAPDGVKMRWLRRFAGSYCLQALEDLSQAPVEVRREGENSVLGRVVKWIGDAPEPER